MSTQLIDGVGIFDLTHEDYLANFLRDCESREWSKFMAGYTSKNRNANKALTNHVSTFQDFIKGSDRAQEIRRTKEHEDALVQIAKKTHNRKGYATYLNETHLYTFPAAELIERENSDCKPSSGLVPQVTILLPNERFLISSRNGRTLNSGPLRRKNSRLFERPCIKLRPAGYARWKTMHGRKLLRSRLLKLISRPGQQVVMLPRQRIFWGTFGEN